MILAHKIALDPTEKQKEYFVKAAGCHRFVWNLALEMWNAEYKAGNKPNGNKLQKQFNAIKYQQYPWMKDIHRDAHVVAFIELQDAWNKFFCAKKKGKKQVKQPKFHKKGIKDSFYLANDRFYFKDKKVYIPRLGLVKMFEQLRFKGKILGARVTRQADRWYISIQIDVSDEQIIHARVFNGIAGVDLGIKIFATIIREEIGKDKQVESIAAPKPLKKCLKKFKRLSKRLSRKKQGSKNRNKARVKLAKLQAKISFIRKDFLNKLTTRLCRENQAVAIEDLNVDGMKQNRRVSKAFVDASFGEFRRQLEYKSKMYNAKVILVDRWYPSSKTCSQCGAVKESLLLSERVFHCNSCGYVQDRDINAAQNLCKFAKQIPVANGEFTLGDSGLVTPLVEPRTTPCAELCLHTT